MQRAWPKIVRVELAPTKPILLQLQLTRADLARSIVSAFNWDMRSSNQLYPFGYL